MAGGTFSVTGSEELMNRESLHRSLPELSISYSEIVASNNGGNAPVNMNNRKLMKNIIIKGKSLFFLEECFFSTV